MMIRVLLLLLPLLLYIAWLLHASHQLRKGKRSKPIPKSWQRNMLIMVLLTTTILGYLAYHLTKEQDDSFQPFRPETFIEQKTTR